MSTSFELLKYQIWPRTTKAGVSDGEFLRSLLFDGSGSFRRYIPICPSHPQTELELVVEFPEIFRGTDMYRCTECSVSYSATMMRDYSVAFIVDNLLPNLNLARAGICPKGCGGTNVLAFSNSGSELTALCRTCGEQFLCNGQTTLCDLAEQIKTIYLEVSSIQKTAFENLVEELDVSCRRCMQKFTKSTTKAGALVLTCDNCGASKRQTDVLHIDTIRNAIAQDFSCPFDMGQLIDQRGIWQCEECSRFYSAAMILWALPKMKRQQELETYDADVEPQQQETPDLMEMDGSFAGDLSLADAVLNTFGTKSPDASVVLWPKAKELNELTLAEYDMRRKVAAMKVWDLRNGGEITRFRDVSSFLSSVAPQKFATIKFRVPGSLW